ncbi:DUF445 family protein [Microscilla marina]|uniref:DUF445 family protein n=1 Tax=Microscilla marina ATCC 23134 TaxID=313606 RepID=A1ZU23_MICM2|nr:DUF445 family protein [Microscilla marina]EAY26136.1 hypothetical protein M23134_06009 [Microscilla marina ATCC 23134]
MIGGIFSKILAGSVVGYITNYLAIQMLFQEYFKVKISKKKKFSLGGVVVKERAEFESQISKLVESDVIHHQALERELQKNGFTETLHNILNDLFSDKLIAQVPPGFTVADIPHIDQSFANLSQTMVTGLSTPLENVLLHSVGHLPLGQILSGKQSQHVAGALTQVIQEFVDEETNYVDDFILELMQDIQQKSVLDFISEKDLQTLTNNGNAIFSDLHEVLKHNYADSIDQIIQQSLRTLNIPQLIETISKQVGNKKLYDLLGETRIEHLPKVLVAEVEKIFDNDVGQDIIESILKFLLNTLEKESSTILDLLSGNLKISVENFLATKLPNIIAKLVPWLKEKKGKLSEIIQQSFQKNTSALKKLLVNIFVGNVGNYVGVEQKIIDIIEKQEPEKIASQASEYLINYLQKTTIGDIIKSINQERMLDTVIPLIQDSLLKVIRNLKVDSLKELFDRKLNSFVSEADIKKNLEKFIQNLIDKNLKSQWLYSDKVSTFAQNNLETLINKLAKQPLGNVLKGEQLGKYTKEVREVLSTILQKSHPQLQKVINEAIVNYADERSLDALVRVEQNKQLHQWMLGMIGNLLQEQTQHLKQDKLRHYIQQLGNIKSLDQHLSGYLQSYLSSNLSELMEGRVEDLVKHNLANLPDNKLKGMIYKALGKELKPISYFGALLGAVTGGLLNFLPTVGQSAAKIAVPATAYGATGWGTNWLAIKMIFRPYQPVKIPFIKRRLPFTPGVVAKNKARFAESMGRFIGDSLLNQDTLKGNFAKNQEIIERRFLAMLGKNRYAFLEKLIQSNEQGISQNVGGKLYDYLLSQEESITNGIGQVISQYKDWKLTELDTTGIEDRLVQYLNRDSFQHSLESLIERRIDKTRISNPTLGEMLPQNINDHLEKFLQQVIEQQFGQLNGKLTVAKVLELVNLPQLGGKLNELLAKDLHTLLGESQTQKLKDQIFGFIKKKLQSPQLKDWAFALINEKIIAEFNDEVQVKDLLGGKLIQLLENNLNNILKQIIHVGLDWLKENKDDIADKVYEDAYAQNSLAWTYKGSIKGSASNLIEEGIPDFFENEFDSIHEIIHEEIVTLGSIRIADIQHDVGLDTDNLKQRIDHVLNDSLLLFRIKQLLDIVLEERIFKIPINQFLNANAAQLVGYSQSVVLPELNLVLGFIKMQLQNPQNISAIASPLSMLLGQIIRRRLLPTPLNNLLKGLDNDTFDALNERVAKFLIQSSGFQNHQRILIEKMVARAKTKSLNEMLDLAVFKDDISAALHQLLHDPKSKEVIIKELENFIEQNLTKITQSIATPTKEYLVKTLTKSIFTSLENNISELINSIDFKKIVVTEIENMHPQQLEKLFYGFAGKYFKYLIGYGFGFGIIFGLAIDFGLVELLKLLGAG